MIVPAYGLMDTETATLIGVFPTLEGALARVAEAIRRHGHSSPAVLGLALACEDAVSDDGYFVAGGDLAELASRYAAAGGAPAE